MRNHSAIVLGLHLPYARVPGERCVRGKQDQALHLGLRREQTVKRVAVYRWQRSHGDRVLACDEELTVARLQQISSPYCWYDREIRPSLAGLDRGFPNRNCAEENFILWIVERGPSGDAQPLRFRGSPKQQVSIG